MSAALPGAGAAVLRPAPVLGIVVPCYNEEEVLPELARRLDEILDGLIAEGRIAPSSHVTFVDDGSRDRTWALIASFHAQSPRWRGVKLSRNRGHQNALMAGLSSAGGDAVISVDADLQDDPAAIGRMVDAYREGAEIVFGVRSARRTDTAFKRLTAQGYYRFLAALGVEIVHDHADYRLLSRRALDALHRYRESNLFLRALIPQLGFKTAVVTYERSSRFAGESKYPLRRMLSLAFEGVTSFSTRPLRLIMVLGSVVSVISVLLGIWALLAELVFHVTVPGWASTVVPIYFICGLQTFCLGVVGEYVGKIYLEAKQRPRFLIEEELAPAEERRAG
ncbi:Glycosyltransferase involved in cell wall bisynthesis [Roseomonas rosea]|uniref:Glycosyltransferase involved in cell wall bisynthesis n=1 Tax=Muricoccus roseus TaxID=198092 RepID=A0A1M6PMC9_9PROT|nr:glycosyltransferase family 2 protein [Roseomonas rosea]SHK09027.1 Glycosyltransferase involved in cell wall bisynthesis [Roseomonas rosea]